LTRISPSIYYGMVLPANKSGRTGVYEAVFPGEKTPASVVSQ
jgi:hypothetical protein